MSGVRLTTVSPTDFAPGEIHVQLKSEEVPRNEWAKLEANLKQIKHITYCKLFPDNAGGSRGHISLKVNFGHLRGAKRELAYNELVSKVNSIVSHKVVATV